MTDSSNINNNDQSGITGTSNARHGGENLLVSCWSALQSSSSLPSTLVGLWAVLVWGASLPIYRHVQLELGSIFTVGLGYTFYTVFSLVARRPNLARIRELLSFPLFWLQWAGFVGHTILGLVAVGMVQQDHVPMVILIHYLWPTLVLVISVMFGSVAIIRRRTFVIGCLLVFLSLFLKIIIADHYSASGSVTTARDYTANIMAFFGAICWGVYSAVSRTYASILGGRDGIPLFMMTIAMLLPLYFILGYFTTGTTDWLSPASPSSLAPYWLLLAYCTFGFSAYHAWELGMRRGNIVVLSLAADFIPWVSLAVSAIFLGVAIPLEAKMAAIVLVAGAIVTRRGVKMPI